MPKFCGKCGQPIESCTCPKVPAPGRYPSGGGFGPWGKDFIAGTKLGDIELGEGETLVRTYDIAKHIFGHGYIRLYITNKRLVIYKEHRGLINIHNNTEYAETNLDHVQGLQAGIDSRFSVAGLIFGILLVIMGIYLMSASASYSSSYGMYRNASALFFQSVPFALILIVFGLYLGAVSCKPIVVFNVTGLGNDHMHASTISPQASKLANSLLAQKISSPFYPVKGSDKLITEAGACIFDLRTYGDEAVEKWTRRGAD